MLKKILIFIVMLSLFMSVQAVPPIYPVTLEMVVDSGRSHSKFTIFNTGDEVKRYELKVREIDNMGEKSLLSKYISVFPKYIEIAPGKKQLVRVMVRDFPATEVAEGEYSASLSIEELDSKLEENYNRKVESGGISTVINFKYKINMAVYGYVGKIKEVVSIEDLLLNNSVLKGVLVNKGNYSYPIKYQILDSKGNTLEEKLLPKLMRNKRRGIEVDLPDETSMFKILTEENRLLDEVDITSLTI